VVYYQTKLTCVLVEQLIQRIGCNKASNYVALLMKLFKSASTDNINDCRIYFNFLKPSELLEIKKK